MKPVELDPGPAAALDALWERAPKLADRVEEALDWIEAGDPRARRRAFAGGRWVIAVSGAGEDWTIVWAEDPPGQPVIRLIAETTSI